MLSHSRCLKIPNKEEQNQPVASPFTQWRPKVVHTIGMRNHYTKCTLEASSKYLHTMSSRTWMTQR